VDKFYDKNNVLLSEEYQIIEKYETTNLVDVLVKNSEGKIYLFVLGTTIEDGSYILITNEKVGDKIKGSFFPDSQVKIIK